MPVEETTPCKWVRASAMTLQHFSILLQEAFPLAVLPFGRSGHKSTVPTTLFCSWEFKIFFSRTSCSFVKLVSVHWDYGNWQWVFEWKQCSVFNFTIKCWYYGCGVKKIQQIIKIRTKMPGGPAWKVQFPTYLQFRKCRNCRIWVLLFEVRSKEKKSMLWKSQAAENREVKHS